MGAHLARLCAHLTSYGFTGHLPPHALHCKYSTESAKIFSNTVIFTRLGDTSNLKLPLDSRTCLGLLMDPDTASVLDTSYAIR